MEVPGHEKWDQANLNGTELKKPAMHQYEYAREALKTGLLLESKLGVNPFKFGMIGSTHAHTSNHWRERRRRTTRADDASAGC